MFNNDSLRFDLTTLPHEGRRAEYLLDDEFFARVGSGEIHGGEVQARVTIVKIAPGHFELDVVAEGTVVVSCTHCLGELPLPVSNRLTERFTWPGDSECPVAVSSDGQVDASWLVYETIMLALPIRRVHAEGQCDEAMCRTMADYMK